MAIEDWSTEKEPERNPAGFIITGILLIVSVVFLFLLYKTGVFTGSRFWIIAGLFGLLWGVLLGMQFSGARKAAIVVELLALIILVAGDLFMFQYLRLMDRISAGSTVSSEMIVAVRLDDPAVSLSDAIDYTFGYPISIDTANNIQMAAHIEEKLGRFPRKAYDTLDEMGKALLDGEVDAIYMNQSFIDVIDEGQEGFADGIRIIDTFTVVTKIAEKEEKPGKEAEKKKEGVFNILISGIDTAGDINTTSRSDVNILVTVNMNTHQILLTNTPRDYYVPIPGISDGMPDKLTHAGIYGVDASMRTLEELYGIEIDNYVRVNFTSLVEVVDALGGVDVYSDYDFSSGGYRFVSGYNRLNGAAALAFCRERHAFEDGDNQRGKNQQAVLTAIIQKCMTPEVLTHAGELVTSLMGFVETGMTTQEIGSLAAKVLADRKGFAIGRQAVTGEVTYAKTYSGGNMDLSVMLPDEAGVALASQKIHDVMDGKSVE